jgi:hypothetical protein
MEGKKLTWDGNSPTTLSMASGPAEDGDDAVG